MRETLFCLRVVRVYYIRAGQVSAVPVSHPQEVLHLGDELVLARVRIGHDGRHLHPRGNPFLDIHKCQQPGALLLPT